MMRWTKGNKKITSSSLQKRLTSEKPLSSRRVSSFFLIILEKRLKKERKMKEKELKKLKSRDTGSSAGSGTSDDGVDGDTGLSKRGDDDDEDKTSSSSDSSVSSSEESKAHGGRTPPGQKKLSRKSSLREDDGDVSSVSTRRSKTERNHYILRMAIDEKYVPKSIQNLRYAAYLIFVILGLLSSKIQASITSISRVLCNPELSVR
jgi:Ca2+-dependent lipid-binding protein